LLPILIIYRKYIIKIITYQLVRSYHAYLEENTALRKKLDISISHTGNLS